MTRKDVKAVERSEESTFGVCSLGLSKEGSDVCCIRPVECTTCPSRSGYADPQAKVTRPGKGKIRLGRARKKHA